MNNKLNVLLSDLVVFYHKLQNKHWYVSGQSFFQIHPELENLYDAVLPQVDTVGELILMNGGKPVSTLKEFLANAKIEEGTDAYVTSVKTLYSELLPDYQYLLKSVTEIKEAALIYRILRCLYMAYEYGRQTIPSTYDTNIQIQRNMTSYIHEHYGSKIGLEDIADNGQVSKSTCIRLFHKYTGKSPIDFLNSYRLQMSAEKLVTTSEQITEIAYACGFGQPSYFNRLFLKEYNMTPNQYRKLHARMKS